VNSGKAKSFFFWTLLECAGQSATLQLIDAGNRLHYQHYKLLHGSPLFLSILATQALFVFGALFQKRVSLLRWLKEHFHWWQLAIILSLLVISSAALSAQISTYVSELLFGTFVQLVHLANIALIATNLPESWKFPAWKGPYVPAFLVLTLACALNLLSYENHPHITDEVIYWMQARFFAHGAMKLSAPPVPDAFQIYMMRVDGPQWYPATPPGWPFALAVGMWLHVPWIINPVIAALNLLIAYGVVKQIYNDRIANLSVWLLAVSPWYIFLAMSFMNHMLTLTCLLVGAWALLRSRETKPAMWALLAGIAAGYACWIRPLDGIIVVSLLGLWVLGSHSKTSAVIAFAVGAIFAGGSLLLWNMQFTGSAFQFPINAYLDQHFSKNSNAYGFGPDRGMGWKIDPYPGHSPRDGMLNALLNTFSINADLFGWSSGSLVFLAAFLFRAKLGKQDWLMLAVICTVFVAYFFYYFSGGPDFGARYWFLMIVPLVVFTARFIDQFPQARVAATVLSIFALLLYVPWRAADKYHHYWNMRPDVRELAGKNTFGRSLVLIRGESHPDYSSAAVYNPLDLNANEPIFAWDRDEKTRERLLQYYVDRPVWILNGPTITGGGYEIVRESKLQDQGSPHLSH